MFVENVPLQIRKDAVDKFTCNKAYPPSCHVSISWKGQPHETIKDLVYTVNLKGAKEPYNYFVIQWITRQQSRKEITHIGDG